MMTLKEYEEILRNMPEEVFHKFKLKWGGDHRKPLEWYVSDFQHHPEHEVGLCRELNVMTENEKANLTVTESIDVSKGTLEEAKKSNELAYKANHIAVEANNLSQKANQKAEDSNRLSSEANENVRTANSVAFAAMVVAGISAIIALAALLKTTG